MFFNKKIGIKDAKNEHRAGGMSRARQGILLFFSLQVLASCSPIYVMRSAYEQGKILANRVPIKEAIDDPKTSEDYKKKLRLALKAKEYSVNIGLKKSATFTSYSDVKKDSLAWVVSGCKKDRFELYTWWFPIVGSVPYKGYFDKEDAFELQSELESKGYETWMRPTAAFSTLGWFNDPLLSTTLSMSAVDVVNTVIHETLHSTIWVPGSVDFNESLANYVGTRASLDFFDWIKTQPNWQVELNGIGENELNYYKEEAKLSFIKEKHFADYLEKLWDDLNNLYQSNESNEVKLSKRQEIFNSVTDSFKSKTPDGYFLKNLNNAEIVQRRLYVKSFVKFDQLFFKLGGDWKPFMSRIQDANKKAEKGDADWEDFLFDF